MSEFSQDGARRNVPYVALCAVLGIALGWLPQYLHGPIPYKFDTHYLDGSRMVWAFYTARMLVGFWVGVSTWPEPWWLRGPLVGALVIFPVLFISLATPECGWPCFGVNLSSATAIGLLVAGVAYLVTGRNHRLDGP